MSAGAPPEAFGRYRVLRPLGRGGMGSVYLADDPSLDRQVAVKVPHIHQLADDEYRQRFVREAKAAARIHHPNVCPVWDVGEHNGTPYLVMPFLEGTPLNRLVGPENPWTANQAVALLTNLAQAVQAIHAKDMIHRDLKPANVLLQRDGEPIILDLGLARPLTDDFQRLTGTGQTLGTPAYMAPEQLMGNPDLLGPHTDVYALGVILYELLTGRLPFTGDLHAVYAQIVQGISAGPSTIRAGLGREADTICLKATARERSEPYPTAEDLARALRAWHGVLAGRGHTRTVPPPLPLPEVPLPPLAATDTQLTSASAQPTPGPGGASSRNRRRRRNRIGWAAAFILGPVLVAGFTAGLWMLTRGPGGDPGGQAQATGAPPPPKDDSGGKPPAPPPDLPKEDPGGPPPIPPPVVGTPREITNAIGMKLILVPAGSFLMGSPANERGHADDEAERPVIIQQPFYVGVYEVTQAEYQKVMNENPSYFTAGKTDAVRDEDTSTFPVEQVTWDEAKRFCEALSALPAENAAGRVYALPTEAEWEYACRGGPDSTRSPFHFGEVLTADLANFDGNFPYGTPVKGAFLNRTRAVGSYKPNALGLFDMHGNVYEWCADPYTDAPDGPAPEPAPGKRVIRGGSYYSLGADCRAACRDDYDANEGDRGFGFRVLVRLPAKP